jgi:hypothetical protein
MKSPSKSPGRRGPIRHDDIEFEMIDPQGTEDDIKNTTSMNAGRRAT